MRNIVYTLFVLVIFCLVFSPAAKAIECTYFPRCQNNEKYWTAISMYNNRKYDTYIFVKRMGKEHKSEKFYKIEKYSRFILDNDDLEKMESVMIYHSNGISPVSYIGSKSSLSWTDRDNFTTLKQVVFERDNDQAGFSDGSPFWKFCGKRSCSMLPKNTVSVLQIIFMDVALKFPSRNSPQVIIGDMSNRTGNCSGHPGGAHGYGRCIDLDYYTFDSNKTQYGEPREEIYKNDMLNTKKFDVKRNLYLIKKIMDIFPKATIHVDKRIKREFKRYKEYDFYNDRLYGDSSGKWNHHIHMHINLGSNYHNYNTKINWNYKINR